MLWRALRMASSHASKLARASISRSTRLPMESGAPAARDKACSASGRNEAGDGWREPCMTDFTGPMFGGLDVRFKARMGEFRRKVLAETTGVLSCDG